MKHLAAAALLLALAACSLNRLNVSDYALSGKDKATTDADAAACDRKAVDERPSGLNDTFAVETQYNKIYDACMQDKGYRRR